MVADRSFLSYSGRMAKIRVTSDDDKVTVDISFDEESYSWSAICSGCMIPDSGGKHADLVDDSREGFTMEDTVNVAIIHLEYHH